MPWILRTPYIDAGEMPRKGLVPLLCLFPSFLPGHQNSTMTSEIQPEEQGKGVKIFLIQTWPNSPTELDADSLKPEVVR